VLLNILLLEDDPAKKLRLLEFLNGKKGSAFDRVDTALCTSDAIGLMKANKYDLLIADVVVPSSLGGEPNEENAVDLFHQIDEGYDGLKPPDYSLAISAVEGLSAVSKSFFIGRPWGILKYDETSAEFLATIEKITQFVVDRRSRSAPDRSCDVFIITALMEPEFSALEALPAFQWTPLEPLDSTQFVRFCAVETAGIRRTIGAAFAPRMGPVAAAVLAAKVVLQLNPRLIVMSGICAGIPGKASVGDVVAAELTWDWQSGKYVDKNGDEQFEIAPHQVAIDDRLRPALTLLKRDTVFWNSLAPLAVAAGTDLPKLVLGPMASGSAVLADARVSDRIKTTQHRSVAGLDMEAYGFYAAAQSCNPEIRFVSLKSVCDNGDRQKDDKYQSYAAKVSAATTAKFIESYLGSLL
jgi:nucleoside phosphorylase